MKVAILTHNYPDSEKDRKNAGIFVHDFAKSLSEKIKVVVFSPVRNESIKEIEGVSIYGFKWNSDDKLGNLKIYNPFDVLSFLNYFLRGFGAIIKLFNKHSDINFVISMWAFPSGLFALFLKKFKNVPYAVWALGSDINVYGKKPVLKTIIKIILKNADFLFADGFVLAKDVELLSNKHCRFIPSSSSFPNLKFKKNINNKEIVFSFLGRLESVKGPDILIDALIYLKNNIYKNIMPNIKFYFMGGGSLENTLKEKIKNNNLENYVEITGNIDDKFKIINILSKSNWLIIPSLSDSIPIVFSESMKLNVPIIASDLDDLSYLVKKYQVGYCFKRGDHKELARVLKTVIKERRISYDISKNCRKAASDFDIEKSSRDILKLINNYE